MISNILALIHEHSAAMPATHYRLDDGRVWSISEAKFVSSDIENAVFSTCPDEQGNSSVEGLIGCLEFYGYPKGELKSDSEYADEVRLERNKRLLETDYLMMPDYPLTVDKINSIKIYRQQLRDISKQNGFPRFVVWPNNPLSN